MLEQYEPGHVLGVSHGATRNFNPVYVVMPPPAIATARDYPVGRDVAPQVNMLAKTTLHASPKMLA